MSDKLGIRPTEPRKLSQREKDSRVSQAVGARMALLALEPFVRDAEAREVLFEIGRASDKLAQDNGGHLFSAFDAAVASNQKRAAHGHD